MPCEPPHKAEKESNRSVKNMKRGKKRKTYKKKKHTSKGKKKVSSWLECIEVPFLAAIFLYNSSYSHMCLLNCTKPKLICNFSFFGVQEVYKRWYVIVHHMKRLICSSDIYDKLVLELKCMKIYNLVVKRYNHFFKGFTSTTSIHLRVKRSITFILWV